MAKTTRDLRLTAWANLGPAGRCEFTLPAGADVHLVKGLDGILGDQWVVSSVPLLIELTGNGHDPRYRYVTVPADAVEGA